MPDRIVAAAIKIGDAALSMPAPARHADLISAIGRLPGLNTAVVATPDRQGFLTSDGAFLGRSGAFQLALDAGQIKRGTTLHPSELFSEDLW